MKNDYFNKIIKFINFLNIFLILKNIIIRKKFNLDINK